MFWKKLGEQAALATGNFAKIFGSLEIPPLPQVAARLLEMSRQDEVKIPDLGKLIASDTGVSARILRAINAAQSGLGKKVTSVPQAVALLGLNRIRALVLAFATVNVLPKKAEGFDPVGFWQEALQRAAFAQVLAGEVARGAESEAFTGALLQDMALPILLEKYGRHYLPLVKAARESSRELHEVEDGQLSWNHAQAGAWMARNWGFPDVLVCCVGLHNATPAEVDQVGLGNSPVSVVCVTSRLPRAGAFCAEALGMEADRYRAICEAADASCAELAELFQVPRPAPLAEQVD